MHKRFSISIGQRKEGPLLLAIRHAGNVFKQSLLVHQTTQRFPYMERHGAPFVLLKPPAFDETKYAPKLPPGGKLSDWGIVCQYMGIFDLKHILVDL